MKTQMRRPQFHSPYPTFGTHCSGLSSAKPSPICGFYPFTTSKKHSNKNGPGSNLRDPTFELPENHLANSIAPSSCGITTFSTSTMLQSKICANLRPYLRQSA